MPFPPGWNIVSKDSHSKAVGHIVCGDYSVIGGVHRGIVFLLNPTLDPTRPQTGGVPPADYFVSINPLWLYGNYKGRRNDAGINFRDMHTFQQAGFYKQYVQAAISENRPIPDIFETTALPAAARTITSKALAFASGIGRNEQQFSYLPDEAFDTDGLSELKHLGIGYAIAAARYMGCSYVVISGLEVLEQDGIVFSALRSWAERNSPGWLRTLENSGFAQRYVNPNKMARNPLVQGV